MPGATLDFIAEMYNESHADISTLFDAHGNLQDIIERESDYLELIEDLSQREELLPAVLTLLDEDRPQEENNQAALLGLLAEKEGCWQSVIQTLFPSDGISGIEIDFRWLLSRLPSSRQQEVIQMMISDNRYSDGLNEVVDFISANKLTDFYPLFVQLRGRLSQDGRKVLRDGDRLLRYGDRYV